MANDNATVGYASTKEAGGGPVIITLEQQKKQAEEAKRHYKDEKDAYNKAVKDEQEAYEKASSTYATAHASLSALQSMVENANKDLKQQSNDHNVAGYLIAAAGVAALVLSGPVAIGAAVVIGAASVANTWTRPQTEPLKKRIFSADGAKDVADTVKAVGDVAEAVAEVAGRTVTEAVPGVSAGANAVFAVRDGGQEAASIQGANAPDIEALDKLDEKIDDIQSSDVFGRDFDKTAMKNQLQTAKRNVKAYDEANADYQRKSAIVALHRQTFIEAAKAARVPIG